MPHLCRCLGGSETPHLLVEGALLQYFVTPTPGCLNSGGNKELGTILIVAVISWYVHVRGIYKKDTFIK